jgi:uncharacterized membrane protein
MASPGKSPLTGFTDRLESARGLDRVGAVIGGVVDPTLGAPAARQLLGGAWLGHALHPLLTDLPIGTWTSSLILDFFGGTSSEKAADLLAAVGVASVVPTALSGWSDWSATTTAAQRRVGLVHAAANVGAACLFAASLARRRQGRRGAGKLLSLGGACALGTGGYLGGHLSYARGAGVGER